MNREVHAHRGWLNSVVPVMEARADQDSFKQGQPPAEVRVRLGFGGTFPQGGARSSLALIPYPKLFAAERSGPPERRAARL